MTVVPTAREVADAAAAFAREQYPDLASESKLPRLYVTPGALVLTKTSAAQLVRADELAHIRAEARANVGSSAGGGSKQAVMTWTSKSRTEMVKALASLDWGPIHQLADAGRAVAMVTLTYPADWESVAGDGAQVKRQFAAWKLRYRRAWGESFAGAWKLEFQRRGAPHIHIFMAPPHGRAQGRGAGAGLDFRRWLSVAWANIVDHPDAVEYQKHLVAGTAVDYAEALKCADPKRLAVYFGKHGQYRSKEYQHVVPEPWQQPGKGPGRFWGYCGLRKLAVAAELTGQDYVLAARIMRRWSSRVRVWDTEVRAWKYVRAMSAAKPMRKDVNVVTGEVVWRRRRRRVRLRRFASCSGFLVVNDGPMLARQLARAVEVCGGGP